IDFALLHLTILRGWRELRGSDDLPNGSAISSSLTGNLTDCDPLATRLSDHESFSSANMDSLLKAACTRKPCFEDIPCSPTGEVNPGTFEDYIAGTNTLPGFQPNGKEGACRMRSLPSGNRGWDSSTRWQTASRSRFS